MSRAVLVTGGAGYIGSHTVLALQARGRRIVVLDDLSTGCREAVSPDVFIQGDVADAALVSEILDRHEIGAVLHFAGSIIVPESVADPGKYYANNTAGSLALARACVAAGVGPFVFSSTAAVYGQPERMPVAEIDPTLPINPYGWSKLMVEQMLRDLSAAHPAFRPVSLRYFNVAGADPQGRSGQRGARTTHLIRTAIEAGLGIRPALEVYGSDYPTRDGTCERDYVHVSDLAEAHVAALDYLEAGGASDVFNCGYGGGATVREVIEALETVLGSPIPLVEGPRRAGDAPRMLSDPTKLRDLLGWRPRHENLLEIVASALSWERELLAAADVPPLRAGVGHV